MKNLILMMMVALVFCGCAQKEKEKPKVIYNKHGIPIDNPIYYTTNNWDTIDSLKELLPNANPENKERLLAAIKRVEQDNKNLKDSFDKVYKMK